MSQGLLPSGVLDAPFGGSSHLVVKRGHHGRYRFVLITDGERIGGEVRVEMVDGDRDGSRSLAIARIARLAEALLVSVTSHPTVERDASAANFEGSVRIDASDRQRHTIASEGDHRG